jgi:AraC-like DNA-binding protein
MQLDTADTDTQFRDYKIPAKLFLRLLDYMDTIGFDPAALAADAGLDLDAIRNGDPEQKLLAIHYSTLYQLAVDQMQEMKKPLPWGAGIGSEAFKMMCYCIISCDTLGQALERAQRYDRLLFPLIGYRVKLTRSDTTARLSYQINTQIHDNAFSPQQWDWSVYYDAVAKSSGLRVWYAFVGWLTGREIKLDKVSITASYVTDSYQQRLKKVFDCPIEYDAEHNALEFPVEMLGFRIVHNSDSLEQFLHNIPYWLITTDHAAASTSAAIKSLLGKDFSQGVPSFECMAQNLHMSTSSLRRRLVKEQTSYQQLKDKCRCEVAIKYLCQHDLKIQDISEQVGFTETSSFVRSFRSWTGMTPKIFRDEHSLPSQNDAPAH